MKSFTAIAAGILLCFVCTEIGAQSMPDMDMPEGMNMPMSDDMPMSDRMTGTLGAYPMTREASGTAWQPDSTPMEGLHQMSGDWTLMLHGYANAIYDDQQGPRGDSKVFGESMLMAMGRRSLGAGTLGLRSMFSLDPATMGRAGYPLLMQTGETADGVNPLVDRQHPHDLFMEMSAAYSLPIGNSSSVFVYGGLPGEPALGPVTFMHRFSGLDNPEAPLNHHLMDATHVSFGVATLGAVWHEWKLEGSRFNGREPDQDRYNIEAHPLDSSSIRLSYNPTANWAMQVSHGWLKQPEQLDPGTDLQRSTASVTYNRPLSNANWQTTLAWGHNNKNPGTTTDGWLLESALQWRRTITGFGRWERVDRDELFEPGQPLAGNIFTINKFSVGAIYDFLQPAPLRAGVGVEFSHYFLPEGLQPSYGSDPDSFLIFLRAVVG
jgi:hypothetical protein